ncbi:TIGR04222 domain-containing membrane protein [Streptomyces diastatochromogenes]|nr:TIGR04222 domain-containing membrane protein [Streptomyces diastatochromogenes]
MTITLSRAQHPRGWASCRRGRGGSSGRPGRAAVRRPAADGRRNPQRGDRRGGRAPPQALALLRGGRRAAVTVALVALHQRGAVAAGRKHTIRANGGPGRTRDPVQLGVHGALHRALALRALALRPEARRAVDALRGELRGAGLLRPVARLWAARLLLGCVPLTVAAGPLATGAGLAGALAAGLPPVLVAGRCCGCRTRRGRRGGCCPPCGSGTRCRPTGAR